ncbi:efflux transporter, RND family, MFP subunit [Alicycliphilus denitrificans K601]|uniref:Efflux transporter, RND family, MFP subunit n=2 Tax=Alicycliphilus denitrificans TaxID=179636 RepID=F4G9F8_ALIDK|nr:efflux transporter, RND family, MFP subunit [Alicycliphilus denitrificans K601]
MLGMSPSATPPEGAPQKKNQHSALSRVAAAVVIVAVAAGAGWWVLSRPAKESVAQAPAMIPAADGHITLGVAQLRALGVATAAADTATQLPVPGLPAQAAAPLAASAQVSAPYAGVVTRILVDEGAFVRQGQPLARIQSRDVLVAQGELSRARSEATAAALQAQRDTVLLAEGIIPAARNEQSQARTQAAQSTLRQATGALAQLRPVAGGQAGEYELLAPMAGQVVRRHLMPGQSVAALEAAFVVAEAGHMDVNFTAPLRLRSAIKPGLPVGLPDGSVAKVVAVGADADPASQSLRVRASIEGQTALAVGQQFSVSLLLPAPAGALAVPPSALLPAGKGHVLYAASDAVGGEKGAMRLRAVAVQLLGGDESISVVVPDSKDGSTALTAGEQVVTRGTALLKSMLPLQ